MATSVWARNAMIDAILQGATIRVSLHSSDPGTTGTGELSGGGYDRAVATFSSAANGQASNSQQIVWTDLPAATITHCGVWRGDTFLFGAQLTQARSVAAGDGVFFRAGTLSVVVS